ncbi:hypothetical protein MMC34_002045 [Xylographa carneopallida]|nr:hypothetical protein [Xylographa carneopallida]
MYNDLLHIYLGFAFITTFVLGWETQLICDPFMGTNINSDHCSQALLKIHDVVLADSSPNLEFRRRLFTRNNGDHSAMLPQSFVYGSCAIGVDLEGMSGLAIASTWNSLYEKVETLLTGCVRSPGPALQRGFGGYYKNDGFTFVVANPATIDTRGTQLVSSADRAPSDHDLTMTISIRAELRVMRSRDIVTCVIPGQIQGGLAPFTQDTYNGVLVRQQGPWLLSGGTWVSRPHWYLDQEILLGEGWLLFRSLRPESQCFPVYFPDSFSGATVQPEGAQREIFLGGAWLSEGVHWRPCKARKLDIIKGLSFQWEWILIRGPGIRPETKAPPHYLPGSTVH